MPYVERDESGRIVCLYGALDPMFQQARNYLSTGKLQERLDEYPAVHAEAARLGVSFDEAVGDRDDIHDPEKQWTICGRWPEWKSDEELELESSHDDAAPEMGDSFDAHPDLRGDIGEPVDADEELSDPGSGDDGGGELGDAVDVGEGGAYPGMMIAGDPLLAAKMQATWAVGEKEAQVTGRYDIAANALGLAELRSFALAAKEGAAPDLSDEQKEELRALESFDAWLASVRLYADGLRNDIRKAPDEVALGMIDLVNGWPE